MLFLTLSGGSAFAEGCHMIGCQGLVRYVFLPQNGFGQKHRRFGLSPDSHCIAANDGPFQNAGLPKVNGVAAIRDQTSLYEEQDIQRKLGSFIPHHAERTGAKSCRVAWSAPEGGLWLQSGAQVRIIGYRTFVNNYEIGGGVRVTQASRQLLFALVVVEKD